jgi:hypothetical protein
MPIVAKSQPQLRFCYLLHDPIAGTYGVVGFNERIIDGDNVDVFMLNGISEDDTTDTAETIDANLGNHGSCVC